VTRTFGPGTFGDRSGDADGKPASHAQMIRNLASGASSPSRPGWTPSGSASITPSCPGLATGTVPLADTSARLPA